MLQIARLSPKQLGDSSQLVAGFLRSQLNEDGGFRNRSNVSDLYYTVFGLESLIALSQDVPSATTGYLRSFGSGESLDLLHLCCLIRCWANVCRSNAPVDADAIIAQIESHRTGDGGYNTVPGEAAGTAYGCFVAMAAYQDLRREIPSPEGIIHCLRGLRAADGGYANQQEIPMGLTPSTAAAATLFRHLQQEPPPGLDSWLLARCRKDGGFYATPAAPVPDLLSTATALHALSGMKASFEAVREPCLDFVDSLWTSTGGFYGVWADDALDCEYTYYGLLALGHLSL
ncbi:MAG: prenyltransferase/squalene oxidase repeat-containing protein [Bryobacteraceae bacterium]